MGQPHPFYRFSAAEKNAGFMPELQRVSDLVNAAFNEFTDGDFIGQTIGQAIKNIKAGFHQYNVIYNGGNLRLVYPSPYPVITGVQTLTFYIQNDQLFATNSGQRVEIVLNLTDGVVTGSTFTFAEGPIFFTYNYDAARYQGEKDGIRALEIYNQNGAAFFPQFYSFDANTGIATSNNARFSDLILVDGVISRTPSQTYPFQPYTEYNLSILTPDEKYIVGLLEKANAYAFTSPTYAEFQTYLSGLVFPDGWTATVVNDTDSTISRVGIRVDGFDTRGFFQIFRQATPTGEWISQRFVTDEGPDSSDWLNEYSLATDLPYNPIGGVLLYFLKWYDFEWCVFDECEERGETYQPPIQSGDNLQFNVFPDSANLEGIESAKIGILDADGNFVQQIGTVVLPECLSNRTFNLVIEASQFAGMLATISGSSADSKFYGNDGDGAGVFLLTVPFADTDTGNINDYAQSIIDYINGLGDYTASFVIDTDLTFSIEINDPYTTVVEMGPDGILEAYLSTDTLTRCVCARQFQATVLIPSLVNGCYRFVLYNETESLSEIYSVSQILEVNNEDCFSTLIEFSGIDGSIVEGFEYYSNWQQRVRVAMNGGGDQPKIEESTYRNSDGTYQRPMSNSDLTINLHTDYIDVPTQKALFSATRHKNFVWNGQNLFVSGDLEVATIQDFTTETSFSNLAQMKLQALLQGYQPSNNVCLDC
jgi:hypothetical protein